MTGHKDGYVMVWRSDSFLGVLVDYEEEVTCMSKSAEGIVFCTWSGKMHFWDINLKGESRMIELQSLPFKLLNYNITSIDFNQNRHLVLTVAGDAVEITFVEMENQEGEFVLSVKAKRINSITKITGHQKAMCILNQIEQTVMVGGDDGIVTSYDIATH